MRTFVYRSECEKADCPMWTKAHWSHRRASYRCRHGYKRARTKPASRPKILYVREDRLLACVRHARVLHQHPELCGLEPDAVAGYFDTHNMIIVCDYDAWTIETDTATITINEWSNLPWTTEIPAQRSGDQPIREEKLRSVWK